MAGKSLLQTIGADIKGVFSWLGGAKGQQVIATGESIAEAVDPGLTGIINIANNWLEEIIKTEALAAGAAEQNGSGVQKAAIVASAVTPNVVAFAEKNGLPVPTGDKIAAANTALVAFLNALSGK
jgi:hypothetical protein